MSDHDREVLLEKNFTPEQRVCLDYVAERAATRAIERHGKSCPFRAELFALAGKSAIGFFVVIGIGVAIVWGFLTGKH